MSRVTPALSLEKWNGYPRFKLEPLAIDVSFPPGDERVLVKLADGREISPPLEWFPRLAAASPAERAKYTLIGGGVGIHWPLLDEDICVSGLLR
jgi:hypothetical protein